MKFKSENFQRGGREYRGELLTVTPPGDFSTDETLVDASKQPMTFTDDSGIPSASGTRKAQPLKGLSG